MSTDKRERIIKLNAKKDKKFCKNINGLQEFFLLGGISWLWARVGSSFGVLQEACRKVLMSEGGTRP